MKKVRPRKEEEEIDEVAKLEDSLLSVCKSIGEAKPIFTNVINLVLDEGMQKQLNTYLIMTLIQKYGIYGMLKITITESNFKKIRRCSIFISPP